MSSTADGFSGRSLTVFCGTGSLHKFWALNTKVYVIVHVCKLQSEICVAYSYDVTAGMGCICTEGTERKWMFPRWAGGSSFRWNNGLSTQLDNVTFKNTIIFLYVYPEPFSNTYVLKQNSVKKILVTVSKLFWTNNSLELFHQPTLMHNFFYSLTICLLHYYPRHVSSINMPIFRRKNCIHTASGIFAFCKRLHSTLCTVQTFTESEDTRCCVNTIFSPEDGHVNARNMSRIVV